jgi:hypothetical protein
MKHKELIPDAFEYCLDSITTAKVFVYSQTGNSNFKSYDYQQLLIQGKDSFLIKTSLDKGSMRDSSKYSIINNKTNLIERYLIEINPLNQEEKPSKGKIKSKLLNDKTEESKMIFKYLFGKPFSLVIKMEIKLDTVLNYNYKGKPYVCTVFSSKTKGISRSWYIPFNRKEVFSFSEEETYAKGLGMIRNSIRDSQKGTNQVWLLDTIINYQDFKK